MRLLARKERRHEILGSSATKRVRKERIEGGTTDMNFWKGLLKQIAKRSPYEGYVGRGIEPLNCEAFRLRFYLLSDDAQSSVDARKTNFRH